MKFHAAIVAALATLSSAARVRRTPVTDADILNYALTLEHLEDTFYTQGMQNFTLQHYIAAGFDEDTFNRIKIVAADERTHVKFLTDALTAAGASPVAACTYSFGVTDVKSFLATAAVLEGVGVSAYLGAAASIVSKSTLTAAGSILTVEARHSSILRKTLKQEPIPEPFDTPLSLNDVFTLAAQFITGCPSTNVALPVKAFPALTATSTDAPIKGGSTLHLAIAPGQTVEAPRGGSLYAVFITVTGNVFANVTPVQGGYTVLVPGGLSGQTYVALTNSNQAANDDTTVAGPAIFQIDA